MSGYDEQEAVAKFVGKGLAGFLHKPFDFEELSQRVNELLVLSARDINADAHG